jgi:predicted nuclease of predicted toxin-antitoxin system
MKLLANENFPQSSVRILKDAGYDIMSVGDEFAGILDSEVIDFATKEHRIILTFDRDYGELIFKRGYRPSAGVIYLRWEIFQPEEPGKYLIELFSTKNILYENTLTVVSDDNIRQRKYK